VGKTPLRSTIAPANVHGAAAQGAIAAAMLAHPGAPAPPAQDRLITAEQAAERLAVSKDWLYRAAKDLPFTVRLGADLLRFGFNCSRLPGDSSQARSGILSLPKVRFAEPLIEAGLDAVRAVRRWSGGG
jgi:predicted DNA-binding transcriptional regulator AlpA